jgi:hypothetical protein
MGVVVVALTLSTAITLALHIVTATPAPKCQEPYSATSGMPHRPCFGGNRLCDPDLCVVAACKLHAITTAGWSSFGLETKK